MELETAVRLKLNLVHLIWIDGTYYMVAVQERSKYGRTSGVDFGPVDVVKYAEAFGAVGFASLATDLIYAIRMARMPDSKWSFDIGTGHLGANLAPGINIKVNQAVAFAGNNRF